MGLSGSTTEAGGAGGEPEGSGPPSSSQPADVQAVAEAGAPAGVHSAGEFSVLSQELHQRLIQDVVSESIDELRKACIVCQEFNANASALVHTLECSDEFEVTEKTWRRFCNADGLRIDSRKELAKPQEATAAKPAGKGRKKQQPQMQQDVKQQQAQPLKEVTTVRSFFESIPAGRLKRFSLREKDSWPREGDKRKLVSQVAAALAAGACGMQLRQVSIAKDLTTADADMLIRSLPHLSDFEAGIQMTEQHWAPAAGGQLRRFCVYPARPLSGARCMMVGDYHWRLDMRGIAGSKQLQVLQLGPVEVIHSAEIAGLQQLQKLAMWSEEQALNWRALAQLEQLQEVCMKRQVVDAEGMDALLRLPSLARLQACRVMLRRASPSSASITDLKVSDLRVAEEGTEMVMEVDSEDEATGLPASELGGFVTALLPALQLAMLGSKYYSLRDITSMLSGHAELRSLTLTWQPDVRCEAAWPSNSLSSIPCLEVVSVHEVEPGADIDGMLADAAGCSKLRSLDVGGDYYADCSAAGLAALAAGACRESLQELQLGEGPVVQLGDVLPLLQALAALQRTAFSFHWQAAPGMELPQVQGDVKRAAALGQQLLQLLRAAGYAVDVQQEVRVVEPCSVSDVKRCKMGVWRYKCRTVLAVQLGRAEVQCRLLEEGLQGGLPQGCRWLGG